MATLKREATEDSPNVMFDDDKGLFEISKRSLPENAIIFYDPLVAYIIDYFN